MTGSNSVITNSRIRKIGDAIRNCDYAPSNDLLLELEKYRKSYKVDVAKIYNRIFDLCHAVDPDSIDTYRIKRIESIIGKLKRYQDMNLDRMWDIAGCRCIFSSNKQVRQIQDSIEKEFEVVKVNDYLKTPQKDGYKSLHMYIRCTNPKSKIIEVQLRNIQDHNWATLVEITDLLYDEKIKEKRPKSQLAEMHYLFSQIDALSPKQKEKIVKCLDSFGYINRLSEIFTRNYFSIRQQWLRIEGAQDNCFILIEASKTNIPKISVYSSFEDAEEQYFSGYDSNESVNRVLTHFVKPSYKKVSLAYSNYILTYHKFIEDCFNLLESLILVCLKRRRFLKFRKYFNFYLYITASHIINVKKEIHAVDSEYRNHVAQSEWIDEISSGIDSRERKSNKFIMELERALKDKSISRFIIRPIALNGIRTYERLLGDGGKFKVS